MALLTLATVAVLFATVKPAVLFSKRPIQPKIALADLSRDPKIPGELALPGKAAKIFISSRSSLIVLAGDCGSCSKWNIIAVPQHLRRARVVPLVLTESEPTASFQKTVKGLGYEKALKDQWGLHRSWNAAFRPRAYLVTPNDKLSWIRLPTDTSATDQHGTVLLEH